MVAISRPLSFLLLAAIVVFSFSPIANADIPQVISYQGKVTDSGGTPVADGNYTMRFRIYDDATSGTMEWDSGNRTISVSGGVFNVLLGESPQPAINLPFGEDYWLLVTFAGVNQSPRQRLASAGYAYMASGLVPGTEVSGSVTSGTNAAIKGTNTAVSGTAYGLFGQSSSTGGSGVYGLVSASSGNTYGVYGASASSSGSGVYGFAYSSTGSVFGVNGRSGSSSGRGVFGYATSETGATYGVYGQTLSTAGIGVYGWCAASSGTTYGVYGQSPSTAGTGVRGDATAASGTTYGVRGSQQSTAGAGVYGSTSATTGTTYGVYGWSTSNSGRGVYGAASASSGTTYGGRFESASTAGYGVYSEAPMMGVYGEATYTGGAPWEPKGVYGTSVSPTGIGVYGTSPNTAIYGRTQSTNGTGVKGWADDYTTNSEGVGVVGWTDARDGRGVFGWAANTTSADVVSAGVEGWSSGTGGSAVYGWATRTEGTTYGGHFESWSTSGTGVWAEGADAGGFFEDMNSSAYGRVGYSTYKLYGSGSDNFIQNHPYDDELVIAYSALEGNEVGTYTRGSARLLDGEAHIVLDETFKWVTNPDIGLTAHLTPRSDWAELYVKSLTTQELVVASRDGAGDAAFDYVVYGLRIGFEEVSIVQKKREESYIPSMLDHRNLYARRPDLREYNSLERFKKMRIAMGLSEPLDLNASRMLRDTIEEYDPAVHGTAQSVKRRQMMLRLERERERKEREQAAVEEQRAEMHHRSESSLSDE